MYSVCVDAYRCSIGSGVNMQFVDKDVCVCQVGIDVCVCVSWVLMCVCVSVGY